MVDEWGMGMNGDKLLPSHPKVMNGDEWAINKGAVIISWAYPFIAHSSSIPIHPPGDEWVKVDPHSSPFPIHLPCPAHSDLDLTPLFGSLTPGTNNT